MADINEDRWNRPDYCPFCGAELDDPGAGFIDHLKQSDECASEFETWRQAIAGDIEGEWSG